MSSAAFFCRCTSVCNCETLLSGIDFRELACNGVESFLSGILPRGLQLFDGKNCLVGLLSFSLSDESRSMVTDFRDLDDGVWDLSLAVFFFANALFIGNVLG